MLSEENIVYDWSLIPLCTSLRKNYIMEKISIFIYKDLPAPKVKVPQVDVIHTNSVEVVGDYVYISSRHLDAVHKINLKDGSIVWRLGGNSKTEKDLKVKNLYGALNQFNNTLSLKNLFSGQHDARILKNGELSVFDNGTTGNRNPRVLVFEIDEKKMEAESLQDLVKALLTVVVQLEN
jgi:hypothetical protein